MNYMNRFCCRNICKLGTLTEEERFESILTKITDLTEIQKNTIRHRYIDLVRVFRRRAKYYSYLFHIGHFIITVGSLIVPALLSVQYTEAGINIIANVNFQAHVYWATWVISLLVSVFNGILTFSKVDKKYFFIHTTLERLRSEGWQFFGLTGRYSGNLINFIQPATHSNQYKFFTYYIEKIKLKQVEEEYYKYDEQPSVSVNTNVTGGSGAGAGGTNATSAQQQGTSIASIYPPSVGTDFRELAKNAPQSVLDAVHGLVVSASPPVLPSQHQQASPQAQAQAQTQASPQALLQPYRSKSGTSGVSSVIKNNKSSKSLSPPPQPQLQPQPQPPKEGNTIYIPPPIMSPPASTSRQLRELLPVNTYQLLPILAQQQQQQQQQGVEVSTDYTKQGIQNEREKPSERVSEITPETGRSGTGTAETGDTSGAEL